MRILSVDTSHGVCSVAILKGDKIVSDITETENSKQAERLLPIIEESLEKSGITYNDLDAIAVNIGPGSFTGVRIGMAAVKGINLVNKTPLICVTSLEAIAYPASKANPNKNILAVLDAKRGEVYCQMFDSNMKNLSPPQMLGYEEIVNIIPDDEFIATGNGISFVMEWLQRQNIAFTVHDNNATSEATSIAFIAAIKLANSDYSGTFSPLYIRTPDAKIKAT